MSWQRVLTPGNPGETRIYCDSWRADPQGTPCGSLPVSDRSSYDARRRAKELGWVRVDGGDYCPTCAKILR